MVKRRNSELSRVSLARSLNERRSKCEQNKRCESGKTVKLGIHVAASVSSIVLPSKDGKV